MYSKQRYFILVLLFLASAINYLDRSTLSVLAPYLKKDLNITQVQLGFVFSSFSFGYAIFCFIGGWLSDKFGASRVLGGAMAIWSLFVGLTGAAFSYVSLVIVRILFGAAEGPMGSVTNKSIATYFPKVERARAVAIAFAGNPLGGAISAPIVAILSAFLGWRLTFVVVMCIGFIWVVLWLIATRRCVAHMKLLKTQNIEPTMESNTENSLQTAPEEADVLGEVDSKPLSFYLTKPLIIFTALTFFSFSYILFFFISWFPSYLLDARHLDMHNMALFNSIPWLFGSVGLVAGGFISDWILTATGKVIFSRKIVIVLGMVIAGICVAGTAASSNLTLALIFVSVALFAMYTTTSCYWAIVSDSVKGPNVGGASGFVHFVANIAGVVAPSVTGYMVSISGTDNYTGAFYLAGAIAFGSAILLALFGKEFKQA